MPIISASECAAYSSISASAATIAASGLIAVVQERITWICNNNFGTQLDLETTVTFAATARTITTVGGEAWADYGFSDGDEVYVYRSYKNDGHYTVLSVSSSIMTLATGSTVVAELSGASVLVTVVKWPADLKYTVANMVAYDYDSRGKRTPGVRSRSLGPFSESYSDRMGEYGYPEDILGPLYDHKIVRLM